MTAPARATPVHPLLNPTAGHTECLSGNEAIVRGALEAGVAFVAGYPGTPSSEVTDGFARVGAARGVVFEYSVNEKVALEMAFAASLAGARSLCAMKHLGLMVAGDPLSTIPYVGVEAGMVIVSAGDPSCRTSPNEQDQRHLGPMLHLPVLDPATPAEALTLTRFAFELSEACRLPVLLRPTTRVCHTRGQVTYGALAAAQVRGFRRDPPRYTPIPVNARRMRVEIDQRLAQAEALVAQAGLLRREGDAPRVVLAAGAPAATCADVLAALGAEQQVARWSLSALYPLPEEQLVEALRSAEQVLVVEELTPYLEDAVRALCARHGLGCQVLGKRSGHLPGPFELEPPAIERALFEAFGLGAAPPPARRPLPVTPRPPSLCPSCGHRAAFFAARAAFADDQLFFNDIGCYTLGYGPPLETVDALLCMGAGFTLAAGVARVTGQRTVGFMGDATFYHSGMPALFNAVKEGVGMVAVILDNQVTAMTGFQESPGAHHPGSIESIARALAGDRVEVVDPYDLPATTAAFRRARDGEGVSVVVVKRPCPMHQARQAGDPQRPAAYRVDPGLCRTCAREPQGQRCSQEITAGYERNLARRAAEEPARPCSPGGGAPCAARCPLSLCIQGYAGHVAAGEDAEALGHVLARTPLPEVVCRVCERPCETACVRAEVDQAVAVNDLKRFVVERGLAAGALDAPAGEAAHGRRAVVVGAGPSGLAAASSLRQRGYEVTLLDAAEQPGGLLAHGIPAYRLPRAALERDVARVLEQGVTFRGGVRLGRDCSLADLLGEADAVYLATGAARPRPLDLPGAEGGVRVERAVPFLAAYHRGQPGDVGARVVVIGGGNAAVDAARTARRLGAAAVTLAALEPRDALPALADELAAAELEGVALRAGVAPARLDADGLWCRPVAGGAEELLPADHVLIAIGREPDLEPLLGGEPALARGPGGALAVDPETGATSDPRVFAGGDLAPGPGGERTVTAALAAGLRAAWGIDRALRGAEAADRLRPPMRTPPAPAQPRARPRTQGRARPPQLAGDARGDFAEVTGVLSEAQARAEAARCLACGQCGNCRACIDLLGCPAIAEHEGRAWIDAALCTGCGVCAALCPNQAIQPVEV